MINEQAIKRLVIILILIVLAILTFFIIKPFIIPILTSFILAYIFHPLYKKIDRKIKKPNLSAGLLTIIVILVITLPLWFLMPTIIRQTFDFYTSIQKIDFVAPFRVLLPKFFISPELTKDLTVNINQAIARASTSVMNRFSDLITNFPILFLQSIILLFLFFFSLRDSDKLVSYFKSFSPFKEETEKKFMNRFREITRGVIYGFFFVGIIQGILAGIGFYIFKATQPLFLTLVAMFFGILPVVGTWIVWIPVAILMISSGNNLGIGLLIYNLITAPLVEPFLRPYLVKKTSGISVITALIGMLGGWYLFGVVGLIIGPLVLAYLALILEAYRSKTLHEIFNF